MTRPHLPRPSLDNFRRKLAAVDALPQLCLLGLVAGLLTGSLMVGFRLLLSAGALGFMPDDNPENFEGLAPWVRASLPLLAVLVIGIVLGRQHPAQRKLGIGHVIERLTYHQGKMPLRAWLNQVVVGVVSVLGGLSAGREGPAIHLGAGASSWIGERLKLPNNSLRVLVACGTAAGISASFNTPIAGVIFAMEVVMMEYTLIGFMPVILASTTGAVVTQMVYGSAPAFAVPSLLLHSLLDLPWVIVTALVIGLLAGGFVHLARQQARVAHLSWGMRMALVGVSTAAVAWWYPQVQGIGYDSLAQLLDGQLALDILLALVIGKLVLSALCVACGVPIGIIGPVVVAGAAAGALMGMLGGWLLPDQASDIALYALLGMAAMMGAVLQAPLAALMALLELTHSPNIILPGMLAVVVAGLTCRQLCHCQGFFISTLTAQGLHPLQQPLMQALSRVAVPAVMERSLVSVPRRITRERARALLDSKPVWLVVTRSTPEKPMVALPAADLVRVLMDEHWREQEELDLLEIPAQRLDLAPIHLQATLSEAYERLLPSDVDALYVEHTTAPMIRKISGIITRDAIESYYRYTP
ncbi:MAG: Cl- channel voltage-gated family protein [Cobetia sp.]|uniref:chloride channel protein n=1 Tax=Cobetia TaxID=204286 RepID=UPI000C5D0AD0|nr:MULTISPECIES: chloride channel protein [Cobetia]MBF09444.1 Cl- channel voltage-gated family protein [Cobetia sp.]MBF10540.1 Cl- channel voltage-gated family protein [Cobetia sp.]MBK08821.1 Cl- channel voltage-gated family protein [Cobetia sp.]UBU50520.1 chloride channel protein [Cobetia amphilecti]HBJ29160.1 Cl- channel voltage-gated family protein [Cobetia sp.]